MCSEYITKVYLILGKVEERFQLVSKKKSRMSFKTIDIEQDNKNI